MFNPTRLTLARRIRGQTKTSLADQIDVDLRTVTGYESGEYSPSEETLARIEGALKFPLGFFFGTDLDEPDLDTVSFRALSKMSASQRDMALGAGAIACHLNDWLESRFELPKVDFPDISREVSPEAAAQSVRRYWGIGELPIRNAIHLLEAKGVRVFSLCVESYDIDAFSMWKASTPFVFLNTTKSAEHSRFDAAHELGHLILHRHATPHGREAEREADAFASALLMPSGSVFANAPRFPTLTALVKLKAYWTVSVAALNYRLHELGVTSDWQYRTLCVEIAKHGYRNREPNEAVREKSQVLEQVLLYLQREGISRSRIAKDLSISLIDLEKLMFGFVMTSIPGGRTVSSPNSRRVPKLTLVRPD